MITTNYHTHCSFCDGRWEPEVYAEKAISLGMKALGFSSHAPIPQENDWTMKPGRIDEYVRRIRTVQECYADDIEIYCGLEVDYIPGVMGPKSPEIEKAGLDYTIGSVHLIYDTEKSWYFAVDSTEEEYRHIHDEIFKGDIRAMVREYYRRVGAMAREQHPSIVGHLDLIKKNNRNAAYFDESEPWYRDAVCGALEEIARSGSRVEVNTGALARKTLDTVYPSSWILKECRVRGIPIVLNSDAHDPDLLTYYFEEARSILLACGYSEIQALIGGSFKDFPII